MAGSILFAFLGMLLACSLDAHAAEGVHKFDFGPGKVADGYAPVLATTVFTNERGYGFEAGSEVKGIDRGGDDALRSDFCTSEKPFFFSVKLPEGNYNVTVTFGDAGGPSTTTVKAESRRLMLEGVHTTPGKFETRTFTVNIRTPQIASGRPVKLKAREHGYLHWDDKLTLEFNGARQCVCAVEIEPAATATTVYLAGDSTVTDQPREPYNSWGQMLPRFFKPGVAVANHAESGESLKSFTGARRIDKILSTIKAGDYLFIQFGHNDQKDKSPGAGAYTTYTDALKHYVADAREHKAIPVLITPVSRRSFGEGGKIVNNLGDFPDAVRKLAREDHIALIDLNAMSQRFYESMGPEKSKKAFAPGDNTHHNNYGSYELAKCIVEGIRQNHLELAKYLVNDVSAFDPAHPDALEDFKVPASPADTNVRPEGN